MSLSTAYELVFESKEGADVTFIIDKKELQAHQFVLITRSPVLKAMIKGPMAPSNQRHSIDDPKVTYEDFNNFFKFIYTDQCEINAANAEVLLHLSHMYDVPFLFETCVNKIPQIFHESDLYKFAEIGFLYENKCDMIVKCMKAVPCNVPTARLQYFKRNKMVTTVSWISTGLALEFVKHCPRTDTFSENMVFQKVYDWAKGQCETNQMKINPKNLKIFMAPLVPHICIEKMDMKLLTSIVYEYKIIPEERLLKVFRDYIVGKEFVTAPTLNVTPSSSAAATIRTSLRSTNSQHKRVRISEESLDKFSN